MEREEGELTDEDLEDISDGSTVSAIQNLLSREPFQELSLTAVSDDTDDKEYRIQSTNNSVCRKHKPRKEQRRYSGTKRPRRNSERRVVRRKTSSLQKHYSSISSSSDESDDYRKDEYLLRQLSDAVRINQSQKLPNCSLRTRLKGMIDPDSSGSKNNSEDDNNLDTLRDLALQSKTKKEIADEPTITDKDLIELRLIALQSAVLKKHQNRRKNKELKKQLESNTDPSVQKNLEDNGINNKINNAENNNKTTDNDAKNTDEDEAILRAVLLSRITEPNDSNNAENKTEKSDDNEEDAILRAVLISSIYNSEKTTQSNQENVNNNKQTTDKTENSKNNVEEDEDILRAMLLASISKKIADNKNAKDTNRIVNKNSTNINRANHIIPKTLSTDTKNTVKLPSAPVNRFIINLNDDSDSDCDQTIIEKKKSGKVAPNQDLFNKSLSLFLQQARAKSESERRSDISHLPKSQQLEYRRLKRKLQLLTKNKTKTETSGENKVKQLTHLKQNNRLQERGKYEELGPLLTKVSVARIARDKAQADVKKLINDLRIARTDLNTKHQTFTVLMQQLVKEKSVIDKRLNLDLSNKKNIPSICTSTPNKLLKPSPQEISSCDLSAINESSEKQEKLDDGTNLVVEDMEIEDPTLEEKNEFSILKYSSPLDHIQINREHDPLMILCPYDLNGVCRDPDCAFRHCSNKNTISE